MNDLNNNDPSAMKFYRTIDRENVYTVEKDAVSHPFYGMLAGFVSKWSLTDKKCLEIGSSKGLFQDIVDDYTGVDVAEHLRVYYRKRYVVVNSAKLPFPDESFDAVFSYAVHEHIPDIETAIEEIVRVLRPGGVCLFAPAWHTRPWFAEGYQLRPYREFSLKGKLVKTSVPLRDSIPVRWSSVLCRRVGRLCLYLLAGNRPVRLMYRKLEANYNLFRQADSDACNSLDPFDVIYWFKSRGFICHGYKSLLRTLFVRTYALELQKPG